MNLAASTVETTQAGLLQRTQKYVDTAALKTGESAVAESQEHASTATTPANANIPPVEPVSAQPKNGATVHVIA
jgi:hypothetical protein